MKKIIPIAGLLALPVLVGAILYGCATNPITGKKTIALVNNSQLLASSFQQYEEFLNESTVITGTAESALVERVGNNIRLAAEKWLGAEGKLDYLQDYQWEYKLVQDDAVNAWCMPGGKIVVYTGILPVTQTEAALAVVLGHEVSHALLNHGQQRMSADVLQQLGAAGLSIATMEKSAETQQLAMTAYGVGSQLFGTLPFSRKHESEADETGLILMTIAGYNPEEAIPFWERMGSLSGGTAPPEFLSTHPSDETRIKNIRGWIPGAREKAAGLGVQ
ncbi:MAG: M48 family metallopeptidase [Treponema sp.]|jgi:predicted Zn-dependent protease|nr:M48 family metallopeptidase [Treponema sp.]